MKAKLLSVIAAILFCLFAIAKENVIIDGQRSPDNPLKRQILYAPFRESYMSATLKKNQTPQKPNRGKCVFCAEMEANNDEQHFIIERFEHNVALLNLFPYQRGHLLIIPNAHVKNLADLSPEARYELMEILAAVPGIFEEVLGALGTNVGINIGSIAGASKPDHLHIHALPRFSGEHGAYIQLLCETHVVQWNLNKLYQDLKPAFAQLKEQLCPVVIPDIQEYYESGTHDAQVRDVLEKAWHTLESVPVTQNSAIVIDVDETALSNYEYFKTHNWKKGSENEFNTWKASYLNPAIKPVLEFYKKIVEKGFTIIFISARGENLYEKTFNNLIDQGYTTFDRIILRTPEEQKQMFTSAAFSSFKTKRRQQLADEGYKIVACLGDQWSDLKGGNTGLKIKIPTCFE